GAAILRHAVGLEGGTGGPVLVDGDGWAVDLVRGAAAGAARPLPAPEGFEGELRHYQAEARGWLGFLDRAGLGGWLALDMELAKVDWARPIVDEAQAIKNPAGDTAQELRRIPARSRLALTGTPVENGLGDLWSILDFTNPGLVGPRPAFVEALSRPRPIATGAGAGGAATGPAQSGEQALRALNRPPV